MLAFGLLALGDHAAHARSFLTLLFIAFDGAVHPGHQQPARSSTSCTCPTSRSAFAKVQFVRLSTMVKPFWFVLAGYFAVAVLALCASRRDLRGEAPRRRAGRVARARRGLCPASVASARRCPVLVPTPRAFWTRATCASR